MIADDIPFLLRDMQKEMPFHTNNIAIIPSTFKQFPKKPMEESHKVDNKFLNNHLGEIEEAVHKKLLNKIPFIQQQKKYHEKSGILSHDNFFHCDLATGTPISYDNFKHQSYLVNPYMVSPAGCTGGDELETYASGTGYGNASAVYFVLQHNSALVGVVDTCYDQISIDANNTTGNIRMGAYNDDGGDPDVLYAQTGSISLFNDYSYQSIDEFTLTTTSVWLAWQKDEDSTMMENEVTGFDRWHKAFTYGSFPDPAGTGYIETSDATLRRMKIGHT